MALVFRQSWKILNLDRELTLLHNDGDHSSLYQLFTGNTDILLDHLQKPIFADGLDDFTPTRKEVEQHAEILRLPEEILLMIYERITEILDSVCMTMTCQVLHRIFRPALRALLIREMDRSGSRLICFGDRSNDLPESLTRDQSKILELAEHSGFDVEGSDSIRVFKETGALDPNLMKEMARNLAYEISMDWMGGDTDIVAHIGSCLAHRVNDAIMDSLHSDSDRPKVFADGHACSFYEDVLVNLASPPNAKPEGNVRVLRNLSKRAYARSGSLSIETDDEQSLLGAALLMRLCWSSNSSTEAGNLALHRGQWAGDRFDVLSLEEFRGINCEDWKDVSEELGNDVRYLFMAL